MSVLACQDLAFSYDGKDVLKGVNFTLKQGEYLCIVGENGSGKTTLMKGLLRLNKPTKGKIVTGDGLKPNEIGYLPQQTQIQRDFPASVYEVVLSGCLNSMGRRLFYGKKHKQLVIDNLEALDILSLKNKCYRELSGGQQQRVLLARALCATQKMLLLDEPVTGLDPVAAEEFYRMIEKLNREKGITIIMVSHDVKGVVSHASHVLHLDGVQKFFGTMEEYKNQEWSFAYTGGEKNV
ncbi:ABC transporter, ATP-binding protein [Eubacterium nodatum ATCC 33099]|nr:ABC transporter, ATP-binding protein [Eubacterium nodatum ATCC 33099]